MPAKSQKQIATLSDSVKDPENSTENGTPFDEDFVGFSEDSTSTSEVEDQLKPSNIHVFSASSTLHGFSHIFASHHSTLRRFSWTVAFLTSLTLFLLQSSNRAIYYLGFPHVTKLDEVTAGDLKFPAVTICNLNEFMFSAITRNDMFHAGQLLGFLNSSDKLMSPSFDGKGIGMAEETRQKVEKLRRKMQFLTDFDDNSFQADGNFDMMEFYNRTGHSIDKFLLRCKYRGKSCNKTWFSEKEDEVHENNNEHEKPSSIIFFASNSTFHGISHFISPGKITFRKVLWGIAFFTSLAGLLTQGFDRYSYYISHPHVTKLDEQEAMEMVFPAVTICNMNPFRLSTVTGDDYYNIGTTLLELFTPDYTLKEGFRDNRTWPGILSKIKDILSQGKNYPARSNFNMFNFYDRTGHKLLDGILKQCKYKGQKCKPQQWRPAYTRYGKCYTFNSGKTSYGTKMEPLRTLKGGVDNGLELLLDTEQDEYMPVWAETDEISVEAGFKVQIHVQTEPPFIHELGFGVSPGFQTLVATQEQRITFLPYPYGECESGTNKSKFGKHYDNYSISACRITCETLYVVEKCDCKMIHMPDLPLGDYRYCTPEEYKSCADPNLDFLLKDDEEACVCGTPCEVTRYNLEMSTLQLPSTQAVSYLASTYNKTESYVRDNFVKLNIFFEALNYETIDQKKAYELPGLFGDIGGQMGLFIGASILTILELFDYVYEVIKDKTWGRKSRKEKNQNYDSEEAKNETTITNGTQDFDQKRLASYEARPKDKQQQFTSYSYLSPLPEYASVRRRHNDGPHVNSALELESRPTSQHMGRSYLVENNETSENDGRNESFGFKTTAFEIAPSNGKREMSMSCSDVYRDSRNHWVMNDNPYGLNKPPHCNSAMGYNLPLTPITSGKSYHQQEMDPSSTGGKFKQHTFTTRSPSHTSTYECPTFTTSAKETVIH